MAQNVCPPYGAPIAPGASECKFCGEKLAVQQMQQPTIATATTDLSATTTAAYIPATTTKCLCNRN